MKDLKIDETGDLYFNAGRTSLVSGNELLAQKVRLVLQTNQGEWELNDEIGIDFSAMLRKNPDKSQIYDTVLNGLHQIDETFKIISYDFVTEGRTLKMSFVARNSAGSGVRVEVGSDGVTIYTMELSADDVLVAGSATDAECVCTSDNLVLDSTLF